MNADGTNQTNVTNSPDTTERAPDWLGQDKLVFNYVEPFQTNWIIATVNLDGSGRETLFTSYPGLSNIGGVRSSPNSTLIAFSADERDDPPGLLLTHVYVIGVDGTGLTQLTPEGQTCWYHDWSPDGTKFALTCTPGGVHAMNADGSGLTQLLPFDISANGPVWSPDGESIAYIAGCGDVWVVAATGGTATNLTNDCGIYAHIDWNPMPTSPAGGARR